MAFRGRFVPQKIPVGSGVKEPLITFPAAFPHREGDGAVGIPLFDGGHQLAKPFVCKPGILPALQHKGAKTQGVAHVAAGENLLLCEPVALSPPVAFADAAVVAVVFAKIGKFYEPAQIDLFSVDSVAQGAGFRL